MANLINCKVLIVGSGGNGIGAAIRLKEAGVTDLAIISKHDDFGGTWLQNAYPGCAVDVPGPAYELTVEDNTEWESLYPDQVQVLDYLQSVAETRGLYDHAHFAVEMQEANWSDSKSRWQIRTDKGLIEAQFVMLATGFLEEAVVPSITGAEQFEGKMFHSSQWPAGYTGEGDRITVVGTGSSSIQIVSELQRVAEQVTVFQRTPTWVTPKNNRRYDESERAQMRASARWRAEHRQQLVDEREILWKQLLLDGQGEEYESAAIEHLEQQVRDPELRRLLTPDHAMGCKRPLVSDDYYSALSQPNVTLVPEAAVEIGPCTIRSAGGTSVEADTIVYATGFHFGGHILSKVKRRDSRSVAAVQAGHPRAYKSVSVSGCPNLFLCGGSGPNGTVWPGMLCGEVVAGYMLAAFDVMRAQRADAMEVLDEVEAEWKKEADDILSESPSVSGGCLNYYLDETGHNKALWPGPTDSYRDSLAVFDASAYIKVEADQPQNSHHHIRCADGAPVPTARAHFERGSR